MIPEALKYHRSGFSGLLLAAGLILHIACVPEGTARLSPAPPAPIKWSGVRASRYGVSPFPGPADWFRIIRNLQKPFPSALPGCIWVVGTFRMETQCRLNFPGPADRYLNIRFIPEDENEEYLSFFDRAGVAVFLQVEPGDAPVPTLLELVYRRYHHHPCVAGLGVDLEWYRERDFPGRGKPLDDATARLWERTLHSLDPKMLLFLKHWNRAWMPPEYRGNLMFVSDSQMLGSFRNMADEFIHYWADYFFPNPVGFQIGYPSDARWWKDLQNPAGVIGRYLGNRIIQEVGVFWVDFTIRELFPRSGDQ